MNPNVYLHLLQTLSIEDAFILLILPPPPPHPLKNNRATLFLAAFTFNFLKMYTFPNNLINFHSFSLCPSTTQCYRRITTGLLPLADHIHLPNLFLFRILSPSPLVLLYPCTTHILHSNGYITLLYFTPSILTQALLFTYTVPTRCIHP